MKARPFQITKTKEESFYVQEDKQDFFYDQLHTHPEIQLTYIYESSGTRFIGSSIDKFEANEIYVIGSNIPHMFKNHPEYYEKMKSRKAHAISIFFNQEMFGDSFYKMPEVYKIRDLVQMSMLGIKLSAENTSGYKNQFLKVLKNSGFERLNSFLILLQNISTHEELKPLSHFTHVQQSNEEEGQRLNKVITFITQNYTRKISIEEIAGIANLSISAFCRYFKLHTRKSFIGFLNDYRVGMACKMLLEKEKNIAEVCYQTGFNNISNFNRQFKSLTGYTPSDYIRKGR
jgi:AraC-like DNA-binding protein